LKRQFHPFAILLVMILAGPAYQALALEAQSSPLFSRVNTEDGLSHPAVQSLIQDSQGFIWIGTQQGLNRYDGNRFEVYKHFSDDVGGLSNGWVYVVFEDSSGRIWVGTDGGLNLFNPLTKTFQVYRHIADDRTSLLDDSVKAIFESTDGSLWVGTRKGLSRWDEKGAFQHFISTGPTAADDALPEIRAIAQGADGLIWVGSQNRGLSVLDPKTGLAREFEYRADKPDSTGDRYIRSLLIDRDGTVWVGTRNAGISRVNPIDGSIERLTSEGSPGSLSSNRIWKIYQDDSGEIWVATEGGGLNHWLATERSFQNFRNDPTDPFSLSDDVIYDVMRDRGGVIWLGTFNGVSKWNASIPPFTHLRHEEGNPDSLSHNKVSSFLELDDGTILVGTIGGGLNLWRREEARFEAFRHQPLLPHSLSDDFVMSLMLDDEGQVWVGTMQGGLNLMQGVDGNFRHYKHDPNQADSLSSNAVSRILQDRQGRIWVATFGGGLNHYLGDGRFKRYPVAGGDNHDFPTLFLVDMAESPGGFLWLASDGGGLLRFDPLTEQVESIQHDPGGGNSPSGNHLVSLLQSGDTLWVGSRDTGLNRFESGRWQHFTEREGLASSAIYGMLEDREQQLWISHSKGISLYKPESGQFTNFSRAHGLQGDDFINGAYLRTRSGEMLFGGSNGFNLFDPAQVRENQYVPPVRLTRFTKFNREFLLDPPAQSVTEIELEHSDYVIGFEFAALDYTDPRNNRYRYRLEGFDPDWVEAAGVQQTTYTNLGAGEYTFRVQGSNNDGLWNREGLSIALSVPPAPWASWWAYLLYCAVLALLFVVFTRVYRSNVQREEQRRQNLLLEELVTERTRELQREVGEHQLARQSLSASLDEKEILLKEVHHRVKNNMQVISSLLNIQADSVPDPRLTQLLTESQQRIKSMALIHENLYRSDNLLEINFRDYIDMLANGLVRSWRGGGPPVQLDMQVEEIFLDLDTAVPCGLIINELVSNALKHAFTGKAQSDEPLIEISFGSADSGKKYSLLVADNGPGLPADIDIQNTPSMGLEIVRILTQQLSGSLGLEEGPGARFRIEFKAADQPGHKSAV
jgi:two-component sensor histidine kinase/ligand-binding sensor domain-containing protein